MSATTILTFFFRKFTTTGVAAPVTGFTHIERERLLSPYADSSDLGKPHVQNSQMTKPAPGTENL